MEINDKRSPRLDHLRQFTHTTNLPHMGQRIVKTAVAVFLCLMIYVLRGYQGMVSQSTVAAIICMQSYHSDAITTSINRIQGTLLGALWGWLFLLLMQAAHPLTSQMPVVYLVMSLGVALSLYFCVVLKKFDAAGLAAIVYLGIVINYPNLEQPWLQTCHRVADTVIGILVTVGVDSFHLPRTKHPEYIFYIRLQDMVQDRFSAVSSAILVMLNRLSYEGANICLVSKFAPAFLLAQMGTIRLRLPIIVMDGGAIYDIDNRNYLDVAPISHEKAAVLCGTLDRLGICYQIYSIRERTMMIYRRGRMSWAEQADYEMVKASPYRNYLDGELTEDDRIVFIRFIDSVVNMDQTAERVLSRLPEGMFRVVRRDQPRLEGYCGLYFYDPEATVENRKRTLNAYAEEQRRSRVAKGKDITPTVAVDVIPRRGDYIPERDAMTLLTRVRYTYSPVDLRQLMFWRRED